MDIVNQEKFEATEGRTDEIHRVGLLKASEYTPCAIKNVPLYFGL